MKYGKIGGGFSTDANPFKKAGNDAARRCGHLRDARKNVWKPYSDIHWEHAEWFNMDTLTRCG